MNNIFESINNTTDSATEIGGKYLEDTQEYFKLKVFQQLTMSISMITKAFVIGGLLFIGLIFLSVAAALALGSYIDNMALGYIIVAAFYLICGGIIYSKRAIINEKIIVKMSPKFFNS
jgi:hypothetical protein